MPEDSESLKAILRLLLVERDREKQRADELYMETLQAQKELWRCKKRHEMDPQLYFMQLLMNLPSWPANELNAWLPDRWKTVHAARCEVLEIPLSDS